MIALYHMEEADVIETLESATRVIIEDEYWVRVVPAPTLYYGDEDHEILDISNSESFRSLLGDTPNRVKTHQGDLVVPLYETTGEYTAEARVAARVIYSLDDYPVLDESDYSERMFYACDEAIREIEHWETNGLEDDDAELVLDIFHRMVENGELFLYSSVDESSFVAEEAIRSIKVGLELE